jgi:hypothetical protein
LSGNWSYDADDAERPRELGNKAFLTEAGRRTSKKIWRLRTATGATAKADGRGTDGRTGLDRAMARAWWDADRGSSVPAHVVDHRPA